ncbi:hypothetical protein HYX13_03790 [Candidatus Woesearchaeota archaeon]|nr:hypothetical protein [Candidatus Woesearchaeota archaeon]
MNRRTFFELSIAGLITACTGSYFYLANEEMHSAPLRNEKVLCDLHAHPSSENDLTSILQMLGSSGLVGLAARVGKDNENILSYEKAVELVYRDYSFKEITPGKLAQYDGGYFARTQEIVAGIHHLLAVGWDGDYFPYYDTLEEAVQKIHARNGIAILNHPFIVDEGKFIMKLAQEQHLPAIRNAYQWIDEVEVHNASSIDLLPFFFPMKSANSLARELADFYGHQGVAASDCHRDVRQVKRSGIYVQQRVIEEEGMEGLKHAIAMGEFERFDAYVSRWSFFKGMLIYPLMGK